MAHKNTIEQAKAAKRPLFLQAKPKAKPKPKKAKAQDTDES